VYDSDVVQQELFDAEGRLLIHLRLETGNQH
jgi:hypothetical protein